MRILFDQETPFPMRLFLTDHVVATAYERGWSWVTHGELIRRAEQEGFERLIATKTNLGFSRTFRGAA